MDSRTFGVAAAIAALLWAGGAQAASGRDARVWAAAERLRPAQLELLRQAVDIDSGTGDVPGGRQVAALLVPRLKALGMSIEAVPAEAPGLPENVVAVMKGSGRARILLIGHIDTVFGPGTVAKRPYRTDDTRAYGPGVGDEKGGVVEAIFALQILKELKLGSFGQITLLMETSEERGSPGTQALIARLLKDADVELNLEPGQPPDALTVWRKGSSTFYIDVKGRAAHAGVNPQDGRNAALELIHQLQGLEAFPKSGDGLTVNLTLMNAGSRFNIIPEDASAAINVRIREKPELEAVAAVLRRNAQTTVIADTRVTIRTENAYPPLPENPGTKSLAATAKAIYAGAGLPLGAEGNGGASESALAAEAGVPALDGLGPVGGGFHSDAEYIELKSVTPRLYLLTKLLIELGAKTPPRMAH